MEQFPRPRRFNDGEQPVALIGGVIALLLVELLLAWRFRWGALALASVVCGALLLWVTT